MSRRPRRILCVHGLGGTAATMRPLADALAALGHEVHTITLSGHGTTADDLLTATWHEWVGDVAAACTRHAIEVVVGQSMGAGLALAVAATGGCTTVVAINPPPPDPDGIDGLEWRLSRGHDWIDGPELATLPDGTTEPGYTRLPLVALLQMATGIASLDLAAVRVPVLVASSAHDDVVDPSTAALIADALGGPHECTVLEHSAHTASLGPEVGMLAARIDEFVHRSPT